MNPHPELSIIVPICNEEGNIVALHKEIKEAVLALAKTAEIIYVNDGSTDNSLCELKTLTGCLIINLNRNYGQAVALDAGFKAAQGGIVISLDGDGQNDPKDIALLLKKMEDESLDVVAGWRKYRKDNSSIKVLTRIGRLLRKILISDIVHDTGCTLRAYKKAAVKRLDIGGEMHRYILAILKWKGFTIGEVVVNDRPRLHGKSKYNLTKAVRGFIDLIYIWFIAKYSGRPLHAFGYASIASLLVGGVAFLMAIYQKIGLGLSVNNNGWFFIGIFLSLAALMLFSFGIIIDLLIKIHLGTSKVEERYYVREVIER